MNKKRIIIHILSCILLLLPLLLTGCGEEPRNTYPAGASRNESSRLLAVRALPENPAIMDYSDIPEKEGLNATDALLLDESHLLLACYENNESSFSGKVVEIDLSTGSASVRGSSFLIREKTAETGPSGAPLIRFLSASPLVLYIENGSNLYMPEEDVSVAELPEGITPDRCVVCGSRIFASSWNGFLYEYLEDRFEQVWTLPLGFSGLYPAAYSDDSSLLFHVFRDSTYDLDYYLLLDIRDWSESYYTEPPGTNWYQASQDSCLISISPNLDDYSAVLLNAEEKEKRELRIPVKRENNRWFTCSRVPLCGDTLVVYSIDQDSLIECLFLADCSAITPAHWDPPEQTPYEPPVITVDGTNERVKAFYEKYGVRIIYGEDTQDSLWGYKLTPTDDPSKVSSALDVLEEAFALYPDSFFRDLSRDFVREIIIYLTGPLTPEDPSVNISNAAAVTTTTGGVSYMAYDIDSYSLTAGTVVHEISHIVDVRVNASDYAFEDEWDAFNPEAFDYYFAYVDENGEMIEFSADYTFTSLSAEAQSDHESVYMIDSYSKTYPTEDRARLWEYLMSDPEGAPFYYDSDAIQGKLSLYFREIRECMDSSEWPAETEWEKRLREADE